MNDGAGELQQRINVAVGDLDCWFDTMRGRRGYSGPVANWWQHGFTAMGVLLDWRYEGIISGYLRLWRRTGNGDWLAKAQWAGDDLLAGQSATGYFAHGASGPVTGSGSDVAACAAALLELALALRESRSAVWQPYAAAADLAIHGPILGTLWDADRKVFREAPATTSFLPHQVALICEMLFRQAELKHVAALAEEYALPALQALVAWQIRAAGGALDGAIPYRVTGTHPSSHFLPMCVARVVPALLQGYAWTGKPALIEAAWRAFAFVQRCGNHDGSFPAVVYPGGRVNQYPHWIAATGDVLHAAAALRVCGISTNVDATRAWLLAGQDRSGGIATARGYGARVQQQLRPLPDVRDRLHIVGWCDKAFRGLAGEATDALPHQQLPGDERSCTYRGRVLTLAQSKELIEIRRGREVRYRWRKGDDWPTICAPEFILP